MANGRAALAADLGVMRTHEGEMSARAEIRRAVVRLGIMSAVGLALVAAVVLARERQRPSYAGSLVCEYHHVTGEKAEHPGILAIHLMDWRGKALPEGKVTAIRMNHPKAVATGTPGIDGSVLFSDLAAGEYALTADLSGFNRVSVPGVKVQRGCIAAMSIPLAVADITD